MGLETRPQNIGIVEVLPFPLYFPNSHSCLSKMSQSNSCYLNSHSFFSKMSQSNSSCLNSHFQLLIYVTHQHSMTNPRGPLIIIFRCNDSCWCCMWYKTYTVCGRPMCVVILATLGTAMATQPVGSLLAQLTSCGAYWHRICTSGIREEMKQHPKA